MKIKKKYTHNNKRQIFRLIPSDTEKIIIEERDTEKEQAYFNCLHINTGKKIFKNLQLDEKFWLGIESVHKDFIYFHKFAKPDLPQHNGIIAFDINQQKVLWEDNTRNFLFIKDDVLYSYKQGFENRQFSTLNRVTGELIDELENDPEKINLLREEVISKQDFSNYHFPVFYESPSISDAQVSGTFNKIKKEVPVSGKIEYVLKKGLLLFNYHYVTDGGYLKNIFKAVELSAGNCMFTETLNSRTNAFAPDSFFVRNDLLFLLIERSNLGVYKIIK